jgi:hypothetical protein
MVAIRVYRAWLKTKDIKCIKIYGDNKAALGLSENSEMQQRTKHIAVKYHYIRRVDSRD